MWTTSAWRTAAARVIRRARSGEVGIVVRHQRARHAPAICAFAGMGIAAAATAAISSKDRDDGRAFLERSTSEKKQYAALSRNFIADAVEKAMPAVVNITVDSGELQRMNRGMLANIKILTAVTFADGSKYPATIHSADPLSDIALLQIESEEPREWPTIKLGASADVRAGEWVCALGSPFSLQHSVSAGIISAVARHSSELGYPQKGGEFIQTDAAINSGNSGGPLVNLDGEVIGINTMKVDGSVGISFAIPMDTASQVINQLLQHKKVVRAYIGMQMINFNTRELKEISRMFPNVKEGVIVKSVAPGSPAHKGGLLPGDIILTFDGKPVRNTKDIQSAVGYTIGRRIEVRVTRQGENASRTLQVTTEPLPASLVP